MKKCAVCRAQIVRKQLVIPVLTAYMDASGVFGTHDNQKFAHLACVTGGGKTDE